ncbi:MAG: NYN domain-containing protein, partial [Phycisphaerales bacterium]|nr:NYN domain-containing protein [Phycisphaerales bacterium]
LDSGGQVSGSLGKCLGKSLYWLDLDAVVQSQLRKSETCTEIKYFSAPRRHPQKAQGHASKKYTQSNHRQTLYFNALEAQLGITPILGWYSEKDPHTCEACKHQWPAFEEKVTDVNIATHMLRDAYEDKLDRALLISADADLVPAVNTVRSLGKEVLLALPPGRKRAKHLRECANITNNIKIKAIRNFRLPNTISRPGLPPLECPPEWTIPQKWIWKKADPMISETKPKRFDPLRWFRWWG